MTRTLICSLLCVAVVAPAIADARYVEIWDPPEARTHAPSLAKPVPAVKPHKPLKRKRVSLEVSRTAPRVVSRVAPHAVAPRAVAHAAAQTSASSAKSTPSFDAIPRQITPEGNVLRVSARHRQA
ncbi:hypothetical protein P5W99_11105 [Paraburkholderia sp. A3BS-1L]|uniref:hypothetical protein n=1 Tax=Paraburkholderia sp. A3BS-1L TaxID=3028375 RepID=UPI003DA95E31